MKTSYTVKLSSLMILATGMYTQSSAQSGASDPEETYTLSPFIVNAESDRGYMAVEALAGGRTNMPVKFTPASMSSLTETFLNDLGINDVREALAWAPNVVATDPLQGTGFGGQAFQEWSFNFRGAGAGQQGGPGPTRNYFSFFENPDTYNVERVELTRGPNSILFGLGTVGGTLSAYTKVPQLNESFFAPEVTVDSHGSVRFEADYNAAISENFALRLNLLRDRSEGWRDNDIGEKDGIDIAMLYRLNEKSTLRVEWEDMSKEHTLISSTIADKFSGWDGVTASETWGAAPTGGDSRVIPIQNAGAWGDWLSMFPVYIPNLNGSPSLMGWAGGYATTGPLNDIGASLNLPPTADWYADEVRLPWESTYSSTANLAPRASKEWTYGHGLLNTDFSNTTIFYDTALSDNMDLQLSYYDFSVDRSAKDYEGTGGASVDINKQLPTGETNPNFGKRFADFFMSRQDQSRSVEEFRAQLNYNVSTDSIKQLFGLSFSERKTTISARQYLAQIGNGTNISNPADWVQNMVWGRIYLDEPNQVMNIPEVVNGYGVAYMPKADGYWFDFDDEFDLTSYALFSHTLMFDDKLSIAIGARNDSYDETVVSLRRGPNLTDQVVNESESGSTYTAGAIYYFGDFGVFANYSENILPPNAGAQQYIDGSRPIPEKGSGTDFGFRFSSSDGRYYATLSRYDTTSSGRNVENPVGIRNVWVAYNLAAGLNRDDGFGSLAYSDTTSLDASGYEFELTGNPSEKLRIQMNYALPDTQVVDFYPMSRVHVADNLGTWNAQVSATTDAQLAADLQNAIASVQNQLSQTTEGLPQRGAVDYTASLFAYYDFSDDSQYGWSLGGGAALTGKSYLGVYNGGQKYYGTSTQTFNAVLAYKTKIKDSDWRFSLNIDNILDEDDPILTSYHWGYQDRDGTPQPDGYRYMEPRTLTFKAATRF